MSMRSFFGRCATVALVGLVGGSFAFGGEIHDAARDGDLRRVKALLKDNPNLVLATEDTGATPLHMAAASGRKDVAELLLANKADVNAKANNGATPLQLAAIEDRGDVVELLLANGAEVNAKDNNGITRLHMAAAS